MKIRYYVIALLFLIVLAALHGDDARAYVYNSANWPLYLMQVTDESIVEKIASSDSAFLHSFLDDNSDSLSLLAPGGWMELDKKDSVVVGYFLDKQRFRAVPVVADISASSGGWFSVGDEHMLEEHGRVIEIPLWALNLPSAPVMPDYDFSEWKRYVPSITGRAFERIIKTSDNVSEDIEPEVSRYAGYDFLPDYVWLFKDGLWYAGFADLDCIEGMSVYVYGYDSSDNALWLLELPVLSQGDKGKGYVVQWDDGKPVPVGVFTYANKNIEARWQIDESLLNGVSRVIISVAMSDGKGYREEFIIGSSALSELEDTVSWR
ncbi:hypothetical protein WKV44_04615 [Spirochaetia bacterium 38H-sp]|uniref:Carbohydrate-binding domain-containing protein n=1 Tax=Rarispira pelagica TaxID=3141764 RepID=A0ABU9UCC5_9SPIR